MRGMSAPHIPEKTRAHLEWPRVLRRLAEHCRGPVAAERAVGLDFPAEPALHARLARVTEARELVDAGRGAPLAGDIPNLRGPLRAAARGGLLEGEELKAIGAHLEAAGRCRRIFEEIEDETPGLAAIAEQLADLPGLGRELQDTFDERGEVSNSASGDLGHLRGRVSGLHDQLKQRVSSLLSDSEYTDMLQDDYYTIREDRYVLPIRSGHKNHVPGIVHGWSASGQTVYIEPQAVMEANNKLLFAQAEVDREIRRILVALSKQVGRAASAIEDSQEAMAVLDIAFAAAHLSRELKCTPPTFVPPPALSLKAARHPLLVLGGVPVVPNDVALGAGQVVLAVTGPNAGGKTVAVKTAGLCVLMALAGLHVPAEVGSRIPLVPGVYSDIGDEQSLDGGRSTFSGHMANVQSIFEAAHRGALVLLDELAVGTDPIQGAALAQAILERFADRQVLTLVTTHFESLKALPYDDPRFRNGAVGFDAEANTPTYHLRLDVPGGSSALQTARRLGIEQRIIDRAAELAGPQQRRLEAIISQLEQELAGAQNARKKAGEETLRLQQARDAAEAHAARLKKRLQDGIGRERDAALEQARKLREEIRRLKRSMADQDKRGDRQFLDQVKSRAQKVVDKVVSARAAEAAEAAGPAPDPSAFRPGQRVWVVSLNTEAELVEGPDGRGRCAVRAGILTANVDASDLRLVSKGEAKALQRTGARKVRRVEDRTWETAPPQAPENTVDVRGMRAHEAIEHIERFLDGLFERDLPIAFVIHGHGTGALKREVRQWLDGCRYATAQRRGNRHEGGDGVTAVLLN
jgi:DNA mismatch repair protein MutS2